MENVDHLREQSNSRVDRNGLAAQIERHAAAVPVFVEVANTLRHGFGKTHFAGNLGAAIATRFHQFLGDLAAVLEDVDERAKPFRESSSHSRMGQHEAKDLRQAAVHRLEVVLEGDVVGHVELAKPCGIAAAAEILQQQRVIQLPDFRGIEPNLPADVDSNPAAARAVSGGLSLHHIQRMTERTENLSQLDFGQSKGS